MGFLGSMAYVLTLVLQDHTSIVQPRSRLEELNLSFWNSEKGIRMLFCLVAVLIATFLYGEMH